MRFRLSRFTYGAVAAGTIAAGALIVPFVGDRAWTPVTFGLAESPARILPPTISTASPVTIITTALDHSGRPVVTVHKATDHADAERIVRAGQEATHAVGVELDAPAYALDAPTGTDTYRSAQWDLEKIDVPAAWPVSTGAGVTVAVIDTGVDAAHPDLAGQVLPGIDLIAHTSGVSSDPNGHGTHVAGTIAALAGNGIGIAGIAPGVKILPIRVLAANGVGNMSDVATGLIYAADHGARVINMSIGSTSQVGAVTTAIGYARSKGVVVVAAAGNNRSTGSPVSYPAADVGVIAVAATDSADKFSSFSNRGGYVDVAAPGTNILSTVPSGYESYSGTSMASPHVAAIAAMLKSYRPAMTPDQVEKAINDSAVDLGPPGKDPDYGYGRVDAAAALKLAALIPTTTVTKTIAPTKATVVPQSGPKVTPVIAVSGAGSSQVVYGTLTTRTFAVTAHGKPWAAEPTHVCVSESDAAFKCTTGSTSKTGTVTVTHTATGPFRVRLVVAATSRSKAATSPVYAYSVRAEATLAKAGTAMTAIIAGADGQTVQVQRYDGRTWTVQSTYRAAAKTTVTGDSGFRYRIVVPATELIAGTTSNVIQL